MEINYLSIIWFSKLTWNGLGRENAIIAEVLRSLNNEENFKLIYDENDY